MRLFVQRIGKHIGSFANISFISERSYFIELICCYFLFTSDEHGLVGIIYEHHSIKVSFQKIRYVFKSIN